MTQQTKTRSNSNARKPDERKTAVDPNVPRDRSAAELKGRSRDMQFSDWGDTSGSRMGQP